MAAIFTHVIALPPYALALFIVIVLSLLGCAGAWVLLVHRRRSHLRIPTTQVEAQVQVQVQVEKVHDPPPARSSSWLGLPFTPSTTPSPSDTWIQRILRRYSKESATVSPLSVDALPSATHAPVTPLLDGSQPSRPIKKELWLAFDSDATLATLRNDPLGEHYCKVPYRGPAPTRAVPCTPSLIDKSSPPSPVSFWEPLTPPFVSEDNSSVSISSFGFGILAKLAVEKDEEMDHTSCPCPRPAPEDMPLPFPSSSSSVCTLIHDTASVSALDGAFSSEQDMDSDTDLKVSCKRLAALIDAISVSFSASTLGPPFSRRTTRVDLGDSGYDFGGDESFSDDDDCDLPFCDDDDDDNDGEWDLGTAKLHGTAPQRDYSVFAI